jgi:hypothetical protein
MKALLALIIITASLTASAQSRPEGRIDLRSGESTIRISVGNDRDRDLQLTKRVRMLEEAVRDLQAQVYDLRDEPRTQMKVSYVCVLNAAFNEVFIGKATTQIEAKANAKRSCETGGGLRCYNEVLCEQTEEVIRY